MLVDRLPNQRDYRQALRLAHNWDRHQASIKIGGGLIPPNIFMVEYTCFLSFFGSFALCTCHFGDNKGGIGEEHKKETGAYAVLHFPLFLLVMSSRRFIVLFFLVFYCLIWLLLAVRG